MRLLRDSTGKFWAMFSWVQFSKMKEQRKRTGEYFVCFVGWRVVVKW